MERMKRRWSYFTMEDVQKLADTTPVEKYRYTWLGQGEYMPPFSDRLSGRNLEILLDGGETFSYHFVDTYHLEWRKGQGEWHPEYVEVLELPDAENLFFVQHYCKNSVPPTAHTLVLDLNTGLVTMCQAHAGVPENPREIYREFYFGILAGYEDPGRRHGFTDDLVGTAIWWTYHEKENVRIKHIYTAPKYYTYQMTNPEGQCWVASNPADYIKINDHVYVFSFVEERQFGTQGFFLINMETLHDVGAFFGIQVHGMECCMIGAKGERTTPFAYEWCGK